MPRDKLFISNILKTLDEVKAKFRNNSAASNDSSSAGIFINTDLGSFYCIEKSKQETADFRYILFLISKISIFFRINFIAPALSRDKYYIYS